MHNIKDIWKLFSNEMRLFIREPLVLGFVFIFPIVNVLVLGGVFELAPPEVFNGIEPSDYYVAGYIAVSMAAIGLVMIPVHIASYREQGVLRRLKVSNFSMFSFYIAQFLAGFVMVALSTTALMVAAYLSYGIPGVFSFLGVLSGIVIGSAAFISLGMVIGNLVPTASSAQALGLLVFFPSFLLSGAGPPPTLMTNLMENISNVLPLTHALRSIQEPWLNLGSNVDHLIVLAGVLVGSVSLGLFLNKRRSSS